MFLPKTLFLYLAKEYFKSFLVVISLFAACIFLANIFDIFNWQRSTLISGYMILTLASMKLPYIINETLPLALLISNLFYFEKLARNNELVIIFNNNISVWRVLQAPLVISLFIGIFALSVWQPIAAYNLAKQESLTKKIVREKSKSFTNISLVDTGIIVSEDYNNERRILVATSVVPELKQLNNLIIIISDQDNNFKSRIDSPQGTLKEGALFVQKGVEISSDNKLMPLTDFLLPTSLEIINLTNQFASPENISFWQLGNFSEMLSKSGLKADRFNNYYYKLLLRPIYCVATILIAACFIQLNIRGKHSMRMLGLGIIVGFIIHSFNEILSSALTANNIGLALAQLTPILIIIATSFWVILHRFEN